MVEYRRGLPERPHRIKSLPLDSRGFPIPHFVARINGEPDFRVVDPRRIGECWNGRKCWICGQPLGRHVAFTIGPMCACNQISSEPPSHRECALFAARACPFLTIPTASRREANLPPEGRDPAGIALKRNPGVTLIWLHDFYGDARLRAKPIRVENGILFHIGAPAELLWLKEGRFATREEVTDAIDRGCPALREVAEAEGPEALAAFEKQLADAREMIAKKSNFAPGVTGDG